MFELKITLQAFIEKFTTRVCKYFLEIRTIAIRLANRMHTEDYKNQGVLET